MGIQSENTSEKLTFNPLPETRKGKCLFCNSEATQKADYKEASIACCDKEDCTTQAGHRAVKIGNTELM